MVEATTSALLAEFGIAPAEHPTGSTSVNRPDP
jgi:hypothetical protein